MHELSVLKISGVRVMAIEEHKVTWIDLYRDYLLNGRAQNEKVSHLSFHSCCHLHQPKRELLAQMI